MATPEQKLPLKFMIDSKRNKVVFSEASSALADVLVSFLTLPLGTIIRLLKQHFGGYTNALGCLDNLYSSIEKFSDSDFVYEKERHMLLHPKNASQSPLLKLKVDDSELKQYHTCHMDFYRGILAWYTDPTKSFVNADDLRLMPGLDGLNFEVIQNLASDVDVFEEKTITVGLNEIMHLLKLSLFSPAPLTNLLFLYLKSDHLEQSNIGTLVPNHKIAHQTEDSRKMVIKALMQKSTNKLLFFLAGDDFVGFLFRLLAIPLGSVASLLWVNTPHGSIDNLYSSIQKLKSDYLVPTKECLLNPKVVVYDAMTNSLRFPSSNLESGTSRLELMDLIFANRIMKETTTFMVTDDLIVTPLTPASIISHLQSFKIPVSDVKELAYNIGSKEALDILKEALTSSTSVLSNVLQLMKQPKEEK